MIDTTPHRTPGAEEARLVNRSALLTLLSVGCFLAGVMALPMVAQSTESVEAQVAAGSPLPIGAGAALAARSTRARLRALREEEHAQVSPAGPAEGPSRG